MHKWIKAAELLSEENIELTESGNSIFLEFKKKNYVVTIPKVNSWQYKISCTCKYGSIQGVTQDALCCHKLAAIAFLVNHFRKESKC